MRAAAAAAAWLPLALLALVQDAEVLTAPDLAYYDGKDADPKKHKLNLYIPKSDKPVPVVLWIHGGGWSMGDRVLYGELGRRFAEQGIGFAAISYRLSPAVKHPEHVKDCARAFAWLRENAAKHGGDPERLFVCGQSAGGHLTALLTLDRKYLDEHKVPEDAIKGAIPMSGVYTIPAIGLRMFKDAFGSDAEVCRDASPTAHAKNAKVPMLVLTEENDTLGAIRESTAAFRKALEAAGAKNATFEDAKGRNHFTIVTRMMAKGPDPVRESIVKFVKKRCGELDEEKRKAESGERKEE